jgi:predicted nucleotidyltransferase
MPTMLDKAIEILRANQASLRARGVLHASVFGSTARGDARDDSDVDLMVDLDPDRRLSVYDFVRLKTDLTELIGRDVDLVEERALKSLVRVQAASERIDAF